MNSQRTSVRTRLIAAAIIVAGITGATLAFTGIAEVIDQVLGESNVEPLSSLEQVYAADVEARALASRYVSRMSVHRLPPTADRVVS